jgi:hypothetical protein
MEWSDADDVDFQPDAATYVYATSLRKIRVVEIFRGCDGGEPTQGSRRRCRRKSTQVPTSRLTDAGDHHTYLGRYAFLNPSVGPFEWWTRTHSEAVRRTATLHLCQKRVHLAHSLIFYTDNVVGPEDFFKGLVSIISLPFDN